MAAIAWTDVLAIDAALTTAAGVPVLAQTMFLAEANALRAGGFDGAAGPRYKLARVFLAAHRGRRLLDTLTSGGAAGPVTSESIGQMAVSYAAPASSSSGTADFGLTGWGQQFAALVHSSPNLRTGRRP